MEAVDGDDDGFTELGGGVGVGGEVVETAEEGVGVRGGEIGEGGAAVHFEGADGGDEDDGGGVEAGAAAFDVEEFFAAEVEGEAGFGDGEVGVGEGHAGGEDGIAAVGDVGEGAAVDEGGDAFDGLDEIGEEGVAEEGEESAGNAEGLGEDGGAVGGEADDDAVEHGAEVVEGFGETERGHDFRGCGDVEACGALVWAGVVGDDAAERAVVDVEDPFPEDAVWGEGGGAVLDGVVEDGGEEIVGGGDGVEVAGEVEVDGLGGLDGAAAAAGGAAFAAEDGAHAGLAEGESDRVADGFEALGETDGDGGFAFACGGWGDGGDEDEFSGPRRGGEDAEGDLGFVGPVGGQRLRVDSQSGGDAGDAHGV